ncbi:hypothetical protein YPPY101_2141, partial [Yersinia pestis PY-101]
MLGKFLKF